MRIGDARQFKSGRGLAAWIGLMPREHSSGGKRRLGPISKQGDRHLHRLLFVGALSVINRVKKDPSRMPWLAALLRRKPKRLVAVALANKMARIAWVLMVRGETYRAAA